MSSTDQSPSRIGEYRADLVASISADLDLRPANAEALDALAQVISCGEVAEGEGWRGVATGSRGRSLGTEQGQGVEVVCDLATGAGKTYLAVGLIEYLARTGVRNVLVVVPNTTILDKTVLNFTPGSRKYVAGASVTPLVITAENFARGDVGAALHDDARLKVFVFTVQTLLAPTAKTSRRAREDNEYIGGSLYEHLREVEDLVVIADEHHLYRKRAKAFSAAIRDLAPRVLVGLTATPDPADLDAVIYRYPLAQAIADRIVKTPVIVYRTDGERDHATQIADAVTLRAAKEPVWHAHAQLQGTAMVNPVLFIVCQEIKDAEHWAGELRTKYFRSDGEVLLITAKSDDADLAELAKADAEGSPVRAIVAVNKLGVGWDVKNVAVIVAVRTLASQALTEQILGRGLRLPFGRRVDIDAIDHVELVAHESYRTLLSQKDALLQRLMATDGGNRGIGSPRTVDGSTDGASGALAGEARAGGGVEFQAPDGTRTVYATDDGTPHAPTLFARDFETTQREIVEAQAAQPRPVVVEGMMPVTFPRLTWETEPIHFSVGQIDLDGVEQLGARFIENPHVWLNRRELDAEVDLQGRASRIVDRALTAVEATQRYADVTALRRALIGRVEAFGMVADGDLVEAAAVESLVDAFLTGAGVHGRLGAEPWTSARADEATAALSHLVGQEFARLSERREKRYSWTPVVVPTQRPHVVDRDRWDEFVVGDWYGSWTASLTYAARFDSKTGEFAFASLVDDSHSKGVRWWLRLDTQYDPGVHLRWGGHRKYYPDFIVCDDEGMRWLVEVKADGAAANDEEVAAKRDAGFAWAEELASQGVTYGPWRYLFVSESDIKAATGWKDLVRRAARWRGGDA